MTLIPENTVTEADLTLWFKMNEELKKLKASEMLLRTKIFKHYFPNPSEGTNTVDLPVVQGVPYAIKGVRVINRSVDTALLNVLTPTFREKGLPVDSLIERKPTLVLSAYRLLTAEEMHLFDQALEIKDGSPSLSIAQVKAKRG